MASPAANTHSGSTEERSGINLESSPGITDFQARERRPELLKFACEIAAVGRSYRRIHHDLFGFNFRRILSAIYPVKTNYFATVEPRLEAIVEDSRRVERELGQSGFDQLPRRAATAVAFRDALQQYARAVSDSAEMLLAMCRSVDEQGVHHPGSINYSAVQIKGDRVAYDASVQEFRRWGQRLTELTEKL